MREQELLPKIATGDINAFKRLFEKYQTSVFNLCFRFAKNREEAEDLCQEVFLKIFQAAHTFRQQSRLSTWIYRITVNLCLNYNRQKNRYSWFSLQDLVKAKNSSEHDIEDVTLTNPEENLEIFEREKIVQRAIQSLPKNQRIALVLQRYEELSVKEIAEILDCSESSVQSRLSRARENLAKKLLPLAQDI
ncbi:MAG: sigma-70 family RNA polymerase sigma factor [Calditrichaeota bacterium]|nr:sigma-70 family RNA polymerase sigma factor [Calditrichota bacterium]